MKRPAQVYLSVAFCSALLMLSCGQDALSPRALGPARLRPSFQHMPVFAATGCDSSDGGWYFDGAHLDTMGLGFLEDGDLRTACGDIQFTNQTDSFAAGWSPTNGHELDWSTWLMRYRLNAGGFTDPQIVFQDTVPHTVTATAGLAFALDDHADAVGFVLKIDPHSSQPPDPLSQSEQNYCHEMCAQPWAHIDSPQLDSVRVVGTDSVRLFWHNNNPGRNFDQTWIYRNGSKVTATSGTTESYTDPGPLSPGTYTYYLRHVTLPITGQDLLEISQPASDTSVHRSVTVVPFVTAIQGMSLILTDSTYEYETQVSGGTTPYHYHWYLQSEGYDPWPVGEDAPTVELSIEQGGSDYWFTVVDSVTDADGRFSVADYLVYVFAAWRYGEGRSAPTLESLRVRREDGRCRALPSDEPARQAWLRALRRAGRRPEQCASLTP